MLYHHSSKSNRQSILQYGLQGKYDETVPLDEPGVIGGVFLTNKPKYSLNSDIWEVDVSNLNVEDDWSGQPEDLNEYWYVVYQDISSDLLKIVSIEVSRNYP